jgi:methyltransferase (TIGR00027 family)
MTEIKSNPLLGATARWTAIARALESNREDRLFSDPWAAALAGSDGPEWLEQQSASAFNTAPMVIRTRYFDEFLTGAAAADGIRQLVILAAGLDTRAYRLDWPAATRIFEVDQPAVITYKDQVLAAAKATPACTRICLAADLTQSWQAALMDSGFDPRQPSGWLLEGFLYYLPVDAIQDVLQTVSHLSTSGSRLGFDIVNGATFTSPITKAWVEMQAQQGAPWVGSLDDPEAVLSALGWQAQLTQPGAEDANFGRWTLPVIPVKMANMPHNWYVTARKVR